jgi:flagellar motility protein MotE (MotC chaperone)
MKSARAYVPVLMCLVLLAHLAAGAGRALAAGEEDPVKFVEKKRAELASRQEDLDRQQQQLQALRADVEGRIQKYTELLGRMEKALETLEKAEDAEMKHLVRTYEAMQPEEAAMRLSLLAERKAVAILTAMKSKKAGGVMGLMEPEKAASLTSAMMKLAKKFPTE